MSGARPVSRSRRELLALLLAGAAGAGIVLLATRMQAARVSVVAPRPLPATATVLSVQQMLPAVWALAVAAVASLAGVIATRGLLRRVTGVITAVLGVAIILFAVSRITRAQVLAGVAKTISPATGAEAGAAPGSATSGGGSGSGGGMLSGFPAHVLISGGGWRVLMILGAVIVVTAGLAVLVRSTRLPVMSARYEAPAGRSGQPRQVARAGPSGMWESLSAGADPTADDGG